MVTDTAARDLRLDHPLVGHEIQHLILPCGAAG